jgi:hypothetical protein
LASSSSASRLRRAALMTALTVTNKFALDYPLAAALNAFNQA